MTTSRSEAARSSRQPLSLVPDRDCPLCPRLVAFREANRAREPLWHNAPVAPFGDIKARLLIVGLAPGMQGANRTGRPFTGDYAGDLLYGTLLKFGLADGEYGGHPGDGLRLRGAMILNAVKCLPPANKPEPREIAACRSYFEAALANLPRVRVLVALGQIAHVAAARALGVKPSFGHGSEITAPDGRILLSSYHCSRYNQNTGRLDAAMFERVFERAFQIGETDEF
jgi:uracil-DNA glycosylase